MKIAGTLKKQDSDYQETSTCYMCSHNCEIHVSSRVFEGSNKIFRDFIYIEDAIQANIKACNPKKNGI